MKLIFERCEPDALDIEELAEAVVSLVGKVPDPERVDIVVAGDFGHSVRTRVSDPEYARQYDANRITGFATAKTIPNNDRWSVVVDARMLLPRVGKDLDVRRTLAHEGYHVRLYQTANNAAVARLEEDGTDDVFVRGAEVCVEEYRVERALVDKGWFPDPGYRQTTAGVLEAFAGTLAEAVDKLPGEPIERCYAAVFAAFFQVATQFAYVAAEHLGTDGLRTINAECRGGYWERLVDDHWDALLECFATVPSAEAFVDPDALHRAILDLAACLRAWLFKIGFDLYPTEGGNYFRIYRRDFGP